jgi:uncharacterized protein YndB with AHSA1/START domain
MSDNETAYEQEINKAVTINAPASKVWAAVTEPELMKRWMSETPIEIVTDWKVGTPMIIRGPWYKTHFENRGTVLSFVPEQLVAYSHLSSLSRLPYKPENYTRIEFRLTPKEEQTDLALTLANFPTEAIYRHFAFYWSVTIVLLKKFIENQLPGS